MTDFLSENQRRELDALGTPVTYPPDNAIFREGQPSRSVVIIKEGAVKVTQQAPDGTEITLATRGAGEVMGDEGALTAGVRSATVTTITALVGIDVSAKDLLEFVQREQLWPVMYRFAVLRRYESDKRALLLSRMDVKKRLASVLLDLARSMGVEVEDGWAVEDAFSQQELAGSIGASRDAVAVELRKLREEGLVTTGRRRIVIRNLEVLQKLSST